MPRGEPDRYTPLREQSRRLVALRHRLTADDRTAVLSTRQARRDQRAGRLMSAYSREDRERRQSYRTPVEVAEGEDAELRAYKRSGQAQAIWRRVVGPAPRCQPGDRETARRYLERLHDALDRHQSADSLDDGTSPLTRSEAAYLRLQIRRWEARARGLDPRFETHGTLPGRPRIR